MVKVPLMSLPHAPIPSWVLHFSGYLQTIRLPRPSQAEIPEIAAFIEDCRKQGTTGEAIDTAEKRGRDTGLKVRHPLHPEWELPVWIANFILMDYGTGAIFGCPAHDQRDLDFCRKYDLPVIDTFRPLPDGPSAALYAGSPESGCERAYVPPKEERVRFICPVGGVEPRLYWGRGHRRDHRDRRARRLGHRRCPLPVARLGDLATALLGMPDSGDPLRRPAASCPKSARTSQCGCPRTSLSTLPATRSTAMTNGVAALAQSAVLPHRRETDTMDTFVDSAWYFASASPRPPPWTTDEHGFDSRLLDECGSVHRRC